MESKEEAYFGNNVDKSDKTLEVYVKNVNGESTQYYVKESTKISELVNMYKKTYYICSKVVLTFNGQILNDNSTIQNCCIENEDTLHALVRLAGGAMPINFVDVGSSKPKTLSFSKSAPNWRHVTEGLNIFGLCENEECKAYKKEVVFNGGGIINQEFDLIANILKIVCPICDGYINPKTCGFWKCKYKCKGKKLEKGKLVDVDTGYKYTNGDDFEYFDPYKNKSPRWLEFKFFVYRK